jgi:uncharacterized Zn finger protein (UPF0148 family)
MKCQNCGGYIKRKDTYCPYCGDKLHIPTSGSQQKTRNHEHSYDDKTEEFKDVSTGNAGKSDYKPLQERYLRGEYQNSEDEFYNQYIEDQYIDERRYHNARENRNQYAHYQRSKKRNYQGDKGYQGSRERNFQDDNQYSQKPRKKYRGYDLSAYYPDEEEKSSGSGMLPVILILLIALLIGFIIGIMMFTNSTLPSFG